MPSLPFVFPTNATLVPVSSIDTSERIRGTYSNLDKLAESIRSLGLMHPPTINLQGKLIAGGRRFKAMTEILGCTEIPVNYLETLNETHLRMLEVEENVQRDSISWQDTCKAIKRIHTSHLIDALTSGQKWTQQATGQLLGRSQADVSNCIVLADLILAGDKDIIACDTPANALRLLLQRRENEVTRALAQQSIPNFSSIPITQSESATAQAVISDPSAFLASFGASVIGTASGAVPASTAVTPIPNPTAPIIDIPLSSLVFNSDALNWLRDHPACCDHIVTDIPYGIEMSNLQQENTGMNVSSTATEHDVASNVALMRAMFPLLYSALGDSGFAVLWCDIQWWDLLCTEALSAGFKVQRWPLVWFKTTPCLNQAAAYNFTKNFEIALVLRKGNAQLTSPQASSVFVSPNDGAATYGHPFAKPTALWSWVYSAITIRGQRVLDPFAGSGSASCSAVLSGLTPLAVELNPDHFARCRLNLQQTYAKAIPNPLSFS